MSRGLRAGLVVLVFAWLLLTYAFLDFIETWSTLRGSLAFGSWIALSIAFLLGVRRVVEAMGRRGDEKSG